MEQYTIYQVSPHRNLLLPINGNVITANYSTLAELKEIISVKPPQLILFYFQSNGDEVMELIQFMKLKKQHIPVISLSNTADKTTAVQHIRNGVVDFIDLRDPNATQLLAESILEVVSFLQDKEKQSVVVKTHSSHLKAIIYIVLFVVLCLWVAIVFIQ